MTELRAGIFQPMQQHSSNQAFSILEWDSQFFGMRVALITDPRLSFSQLTTIIGQLRDASVDLAYWPADTLHSEEQIASIGGLHVDAKTTYLTALPSPHHPVAADRHSIQPADSGICAQDLECLAVESAAHSRFSVDPHIPKDACDRLYRTWLRRSLTKELADEVLVATRDDGGVNGFITIGHRGTRGEIGLVAVTTNARGLGIGSALMWRAMCFFEARGYRDVQVVTQAANIPACRLYEKCGFAVARQQHFYHIWL